ncbi:MAG: EAL domain-containing protein [Pseudolabrys sp.]
MRVFSRRNLIAVGLCGLLAATLVGFDSWLGSLIDRRGKADVDVSVRRAVVLADARLRLAMDELDKLSRLGIGSCVPDHVRAMRQAAFDSTPVKEVSIVTATGETLCTHLGLPLGARRLLASEPLPGDDRYTVEVFEVENTGMVRLRRKAGAGPNSVAALIPSSLLIPQVSNQGKLFSAYAHVATRGGATIGILGQRPNGDTFNGKAASALSGFVAEVVMPRAPVLASHADMRWLGFSVIAACALCAAVVLLTVSRRPDDNPIAELKRALAAGELVPYYQPIVDIRSGQLRGAEVLVRWRKPDGSLVLPGAFIPLAESSGLIREMTRNLMRQVCVEAGPTLGRRPALKVSFNFAGQLFRDDSIVKDVRKAFAGSPVRMSQVVLEVTERDPIENFTETRRTIAALQGLGVRIAIDDVGTGHSGLSYMLKLGVDIIKIDKMFVDAIGTDRNSTTIVETLIDLAHNMRMDVVAEGVESFEQVMHLRELGVRSAQGYVFAPPLPGSAFLQLVEAIDPQPAEEAPAGKAAA